MTIFYYYINN